MTNARFPLAGTWLRSVAGRDVDFVTVPGGYPPLGECTLTRHFAAPWTAPGEDRVFLVTEGVLASAVFALNGQELGRAGPWATYRFELPRGLLRPSDNVVQAHVRDLGESFGPTPGRRFDAGLVRDLYLERRPRTFLESLAFRADVRADASAAVCTVAVELNGPDAPAVRLVLAERTTGRVVAEATATRDRPATFTVAWPHLWSPAIPNLYTLTATVPGNAPDVLVEQVGFRRLEVRGQDFYLNGERLLLKGVCRHEFTSASGYSPSVAEIRRELALIRHAGFNYIRLVHSPQAPAVCRLAAELGLLVSEEPGTCFHNLGDEAIAAPALECLRRTVKRDRNVPSIFAWLIYNECPPHVGYAVQAARVCRELDPGCRLAMADCSGQDEAVKAMVAAADLTFYGINVYSFWPNDYCHRMKTYADRPLVFTEWGGWLGQGNARVLDGLCQSFALHTRPQEPLRLAGCSFWAWADYEEHSRPGGAAIEGWTVEGLVDQRARPKPDLFTLSQMCFAMDHPEPETVPTIEVLLRAPRRDAAWEPVLLDTIPGDQSALEQRIADWRRTHLPQAADFIPVTPTVPPLPRFGRLLVDGIEFVCRDVTVPASPLLLGRGREELVIPIERRVRAVAILGHVALQGGYPSSAVFSVHHRDAERPRDLGAPAAAYDFIFADGTETQPLRHGLEVLRGNNICRWWTPQPRAPHTRPAVQTVISPSYEVLRVDLWERAFPAPRQLTAIRWRLTDTDAVLALYAVSISVSE